MSESKPADLYPLFRFMDALKKAEGDPRLNVLVAHGLVELFANAVIDAKCRNGKRITEDSRGYPHSVKLVILNEIGLLSDRQLQLYDWFRKLRNRAAHDPLFAVVPADLARFSEKYRDPDRFARVCRQLVLGFWNMNVRVLAPVFMVGLKTFVEARDAAAENARSRSSRSKGHKPSTPLPDAELMGAVSLRRDGRKRRVTRGTG